MNHVLYSDDDDDLLGGENLRSQDRDIYEQHQPDPYLPRSTSPQPQETLQTQQPPKTKKRASPVKRKAKPVLVKRTTRAAANKSPNSITPSQLEQNNVNPKPQDNNQSGLILLAVAGVVVVALLRRR